ncbi:expressed protein [Phakopsora pachyrhizi]|uniref:Expressed protein n=1 Tax=Phakopsora pachyrhizi TaxID=170000 RepID=A0AAV0B6K0_PHAPC|nr:expressed protein [Phakopsora pachyrhizi]
MILLLFNEMKLLAFVGDFFTPMLFFLLFFYSHSTILCSSVLLHCSTALLFFLIVLNLFILYLLLFCPFIFVLSLSCLNPLNTLFLCCP